MLEIQSISEETEVIAETIEIYYLGPIRMKKITRGATREFWDALKEHMNSLERAMFFGEVTRCRA